MRLHSLLAPLLIERMNAAAFHIAIFCKAAVAGSVKTRLIPAYGAEGAKDIYVQLAQRTIATVRTT